MPRGPGTAASGSPPPCWKLESMYERAFSGRSTGRPSDPLVIDTHTELELVVPIVLV